MAAVWGDIWKRGSGSTLGVLAELFALEAAAGQEKGVVNSAAVSPADHPDGFVLDFDTRQGTGYSIIPT